ncbi:DUF169 domain-containing protein [Dorea sp. Marseille-P4042]|uniref:DUF169 domain-containing protein n=1 Tax=Dorea sp. Marseille-P4042 TaxID=2080749 RepID=UPI00131A1EFD|nr:DUF169 domain-containing protein [Dorea sp. Marseille-P4042]
MKKEVVEFQTLLKFETNRKLVGVKFIYDKEEYNSVDIKEATHQMFFCMMIKAATVGHSMKVKKEHIYCSAAAEVLGFTEISWKTKTGRTQYERNMYGTEKASFDIANSNPYLEHNIFGMCIQPLEDFKYSPDMVIAFCNPYTAMRIIQGYSYFFGLAKQIGFCGMGGVCTELLARSYKNQDLNISFLCSGTRFAAGWKDDEVGVSFPYHMFERILEGVRCTVNTFEPDDKKNEILQRAKKNGILVDIKEDTNYYESSLGVAKMGTIGYRKKCKKEKNVYE